LTVEQVTRHANQSILDLSFTQAIVQVKAVQQAAHQLTCNSIMMILDFRLTSQIA
jgi:hypothetical protein